MKKIIISIILTAIFSPCAMAAGEIIIPAEINSRIFSTQGAQPLDNLERTHYTNNAIMQIENKQKPVKQVENKDPNIVPVQEKTKFIDNVKGIRVIW